MKQHKVDLHSSYLSALTGKEGPYSLCLYKVVLLQSPEVPIVVQLMLSTPGRVITQIYQILYMMLNFIDGENQDASSEGYHQLLHKCISLNSARENMSTWQEGKLNNIINYIILKFFPASSTMPVDLSSSYVNTLRGCQAHTQTPSAYNYVTSLVLYE